MGIIFLIYLFLAIALIIATFVSKRLLRKIFFSLTLLIVIAPLCFLIFLGIFKSQIQQGKILPSFGSILLLISPPEDLWTPLGITSLKPNKQEYEFEICHKYVGNHDITISFKKLDSMEIATNNFKASVTFEKDGEVVYSKTSEHVISYWGKTNSGIIFIRYEVPDNVPINTHLNAKILIEGNIKQFLDEYGKTNLIVKKGADL